jgi:hypothetical protein
MTEDDGEPNVAALLDTQHLEKRRLMVARDGIEPPTPAFSDVAFK